MEIAILSFVAGAAIGWFAHSQVFKQSKAAKKYEQIVGGILKWRDGMMDAHDCLLDIADSNMLNKEQVEGLRIGADTIWKQIERFD